MRALVTGGAGFIGSHLVDALLARGDDVAVLDDLSSGRRERVPDGVALHVADIADAPATAAALAEARPEVVFHLAAQVDVRHSVADPALDARRNVAGTASVLEGARLAGARRVLLASTGGALYGEGVALPTPEDASLEPFSPYGTSKAAAELYLGLYHRLYGLSTMALRFGNVYGPRQDPHGEAGVIAIFAGAVAEGRTVTVFGDGTQTRDYIYVGDVVDGLPRRRRLRRDRRGEHRHRRRDDRDRARPRARRAGRARARPHRRGRAQLPGRLARRRRARLAAGRAARGRPAADARRRPRA